MNKIIIALLVSLGLATSACVVQFGSIRGSGDITTEQRDISGITGVSLSTLGDLEIVLGNEESLQIEAEDNLLPYIETRVQAGILSIETSSGTNLQPTRSVRYLLTVKELDSLETSSSGSITAPALEGRRFTIKISSSGNIDLTGIQADSLRVNISSSGNLTIKKGQVIDQDIIISSSGGYMASDVRSETATVNISSSGEATVWVTERLNATLSSSGNVNFYGEPRITENTTSSGRVENMGNK